MFSRRQTLVPSTEKAAAASATTITTDAAITAPPSYKLKDHVSAKPTLSPSLYLLVSLIFVSALLLFLSFTTTLLRPNRLQSPPSSTPKPACPAGILPFYIYPLPPKFNDALLARCQTLNIYTDMCPYVSHDGLGQPLSLPGWFSTHQFLAEIIFHRRALLHSCRALHPAQARLFYVPFYAGLYASSVFRQRNHTTRDSLALELADHLAAQPWWRRSHGRDHFLVSGRTAWDFLRPTTLTDQDDFGANCLLNLPSIRNMSILTVERQPWDRSLRQHGIPYPSYFHPLHTNSLSTWQHHIVSLDRPHLFSFVGATRKGLEKAIVRDEIIRQCNESTNCVLLDCSGGRVGQCYDPIRVLRVMEGSRFCLQAPGDSYTRRSTFDSFLAGCVPVFFSEHTAYSQYAWYLPVDKDSYSLFIDEKGEDMKTIERVLAGIPESRVSRMRENIMMRILPNVTYMHPDADGDVFDAVDIALMALSDDIRSNPVDSSTSTD